LNRGSTLKIGGVSVGLVGLDQAVARLRESDPSGSLTPGEAASRLLSSLEGRNYVPDSAREAYLAALAAVWEGKQGEDGDAAPSIRSLGPGCVSCNRLERIVRQVRDERGIAADIEHIHDLDEIWRYGVMQTPALVIDDKVLCAGRLPSKAQVEIWVNELLGG
jgi:small redox-active disulfide protein 2